ncbi:MAG: Lrp/AsnC family transcriptional regulator [Ornithinimicrobium sp.]|jgi:DNA-binding Lrp family transcriptional regulator|uniref:Lrp/AsnC family transcriptional regulator n=1 Tax=Ornithinimicrobium sp. TaxID=1977084 RepID=UPI001824024D|nr:Lrp/AsnC ligand binding domain-containing protein [Actinomycetota bacterium]
MVHAYILIQTQVGRSSAVAQAISDLEGVTAAEDVTGPYDVIARIEAPSVDDLGRMVIAKIQAVPDITRTTTCTVVHFSA